MFYEIFEKLCHDNNTSPFSFCKSIGLAGGTAAYWKKSGKPPKRETLEKIAEKFEVSVDYLLGRKEQKKSATNRADSPVKLDVHTVAEWADILARLSDDQLLQLKKYAEFLLSQNK